MQTNCSKNASGSWVQDDGTYVRIHGRHNGTWDVVRVTYQNGERIRSTLVDCARTHESALRIASNVRNESNA